MYEEKKNIVLEKSYKLALHIINITDKLNNKILANQILRSGTSVGANINEAQAALTKKEFIAKISIAAKEIRETKYWLMLLTDTNKIERHLGIEQLIDEIIKLLTKIIKSAQENIIH